MTLGTLREASLSLRAFMVRVKSRAGSVWSHRKTHHRCIQKCTKELCGASLVGPMVKKVKVVQLNPTLCNPMDCKESPCNAEYTGSIPGLGRSYMLGTIKPTRHNY